MGGCLGVGACEGAVAEVGMLEAGSRDWEELVGAFEEPGRSSVEEVAMRFSGREDVVAVLLTLGIAPVLEDWARKACCCTKSFIFSCRGPSCGAACCADGGSEGRSLSSMTLQEREGCSRIWQRVIVKGSRSC